MGTNYYHMKNICRCCGRSDNVHIGKRSFGWRFNFHATDEERSWQNWKKALEEGIITDEYGTSVTREQMIAIVEETRAARLNHYDMYPEGNFLDAEGFTFSEHEFS